MEITDSITEKANRFLEKNDKCLFIGVTEVKEGHEIDISGFNLGENL